MLSFSWPSPARRNSYRVAFLSTAVLLAAGVVHSQAADTHSDTSTATESSSNDYLPMAGDGSAALPSAPASGSGGHGQYDNRSSGGSHGIFSNLAFEAGGGGNAPTSDSSPYITWGGNFTLGAGKHFSHGISLLAEYQFIDDKLPGALIAETGANGGNAHIWSLTLAPVIDLFPKKSNTVYVTGGGGFYRKVTNFTDPQQAEYCTYYYCGIGYQNVVVGHFSSNQGGWNIGAGYAHKMGGMYGDGKMQLFAEARYLDIDTPAVVSNPNGLGTTTVAAGTKLVPVTFGVRF